MSWSATTKAWQKMHKGVRYQVYCSELEAEPTKEGSYQLANQWWESKLATIKPSLPPHYRQALATLRTIHEANEMGPGPFVFVPPGMIDEASLEREGMKANPIPVPVALLDGNPFEGEARAVFADRLMRLQPSTTPKAQTIPNGPYPAERV